MSDPALIGLLAALSEDDLDTVLILADYLEDHGDPRARTVRQLHGTLYDFWMFAPLSFRHFKLINQLVLPLFPEYDEEIISEDEAGE